jgi:hypothetical protein
MRATQVTITMYCTTQGLWLSQTTHTYGDGTQRYNTTSGLRPASGTCPASRYSAQSDIQRVSCKQPDAQSAALKVIRNPNIVPVAHTNRSNLAAATTALPVHVTCSAGATTVIAAAAAAAGSAAAAAGYSILSLP